MTKTINFLVYGTPGVGKTTFSALTPNVLLCDTENSSAHFSNMGDRRVAITSFSNLLPLLERAKKGEFKTIAIDSLDELVANQLKTEVKSKGYARADGQLTLEGWGVMKDRLLTMLRMFRDAGVNVLITSHAENEDIPGEGRMWRCKLPSNWSKDVLAMMDAAGYLTWAKDQEGNTVRRLYLRPTSQFDAKARGDIDYEKGEVKDILPPFLDNTTFGKVLKIYEDHYASLTKPVEGKEPEPLKPRCENCTLKGKMSDAEEELDGKLLCTSCAIRYKELKK